MQAGTVSRLRFFGRSWRFAIHFWRNIVRFGKSWMCKKKTSVWHSSTESEIISLDAGLRLDGIPALDLWDLIVSVLGKTTQNHDRTVQSVVNKSEACSPPHTIHKRKQSQRVINDLDNIDFIPSNVQSSHQEALFYLFEDNEAVIKMIMEGSSPTLRHVSRTHRVALDWWFHRINLDSKIKYIDTKNQLADVLTKGNFTRDKWNHLLCLFNIRHFSSTECSEVMSKRAQKDSGEERVTAKSKPMMNLVTRWSERTLVVLPSTASERAWGKPDTKVNLLWACRLWSTIERGDPLYTYTHQATQNGTLMKLGLLKSGNLMNWWTIERGDPLWTHSTRTDSLLKTIRWILTPKQNQKCRWNPDHSCKGEWSSAKEAEPILKRCNRRQWRAFCDMGNVYVFYIASICIHGEELLRQLAFRQKYRRFHNETDVRYIWYW